VAALRRRLEAERSRLQAEVGRLSLESGRVGYGNHMADDASDVFEQAKNLTLRRHLENLLAEVNEALHRLDDGNHGICQMCGGAIDAARLQAVPYASLCLRCKVHSEGRGSG